jgi:hypothetical protein
MVWVPWLSGRPKMRRILAATAALTAAFSLAGCDAADRAALSGVRAPVPAAAPAAPAAASAALLFPPATQASAPRLRHVSAAAHRTGYAHGRHRHLARWRSDSRVRATAYAQQIVTGPAYDDWSEARERQVRRRVEAEARWDERRSAYAEGYGGDEFRAGGAPAAAGRDRDGFLTWPGKLPDRR